MVFLINAELKTGYDYQYHHILDLKYLKVNL
jgi:hypothetical protein